MPSRGLKWHVAIKLWAPKYTNRLVHLFSNNSTVVTIFQAERGRDPFLQACAREIWLHCATWDVTLVVGHGPGESLTLAADALSRYDLGQVFRECVDVVLKEMGIICVPVP